MSLERYLRQIPLIGKDGQRKLSESSVTVVGAGGLGTPASIYLACAGVGKIRLIDPGEPEVSNLNRQFMYCDLRKKSKAELLAEKLREINPEIEVEAIPERVEKGNLEILGEPNVLVDCLDTFSSRMILNEYAVQKEIPLVHAGVEGFYGQIITILPGKSPCLACLFRNLKDKRGIPIFGFTAGVLGSLEAAEAVKVILGIPSLVGRLLFVDLKEMKFEEIKVKRDPNCPVCSSKRYLHPTEYLMKFLLIFLHHYAFC